MNQNARKFVVLLGSLRQGSYNRAVANTLPQLAPAEVEIELLPSIGQFPLYDADVQAQGIPEAVSAMGAAIRAADGVIIVSPEYNYSLPGGLKNALDWLSRLPDQPFAGKPVAIQSASMGILGGARMQYHLRQVLVFLDARVLNKPEIMIGAVHTKLNPEATALLDSATRDLITKQLHSLTALIN